MSLLEKLRAASSTIEAAAVNGWHRCSVSAARWSSTAWNCEHSNLVDMLDVPQHGRTAGTYRRLAKLMAELGWTAVRVRDLTRGGYKEQVRGYVRVGNR
jgi:hypothetical protein